jgi:hypothetical protein
MRVRYIPLSGVLFFASLLLAHCILASNPMLFAQTGMPGPNSKVGIKIIFPMTNSTVPVGPLVVNGTSTDTSQTDCRVHIDWNDLKPMQNVTAAGINGTNDYSKWTFTFSQNYHLIVEGTNELTSKIVCLADSLGNITTKFYSINVTGINVNISSNSSSTPAGANQTNYKSDGFQTVTYQGVLPQYKGDTNTKSVVSDGKENDHSDKQDAYPATTVTDDDNESDTTNLVTDEAGSSKPSGAIDGLDAPKEDTVRPSEIAPEVVNSKAENSKAENSKADNVEPDIDEVNSAGADIARISDGTEIGKTTEVGNIVDLSDDGDAAIAHKSDNTKEQADVEKGFNDVTDDTELHASEVDTPEVDLREVNEDANASDDTNLAHQSEVNIDQVHIADSNALDVTELDTSVPITNADVGSFIDNTPSKDIQVEDETSISDKGDTSKALSEFHNNVKDTIQEGIIDDGEVSDTQPVKLKAMDKDKDDNDKKADAKDMKPMKPKKVQKKKIPIPEFDHKDPFYAHIN